MNRFRLLALVSLALAATASMPGSSTAQPELQNVMKAKLQHVHRVMDGLALEDFDRIQKAAQALGTLSRADAWNLHKTPEYVKYSKDFQDLCDSLAANAKAKRLESCTLDYVQMTMLCVKCHSHTRKIGVAAR